MRALLLAAGRGTRLRPLTNHVPKALVTVGGRPLLDHWLNQLFAAGMERVAINLHHRASEVSWHVRRSPWADRVDLYPERQLLGTAGTTLKHRRWFGRGPAFIAHADVATDLDIQALIAAHAARPAKCVATIVTFETDDPTSCGIVELNDGVVVRWDEKPEAPSDTTAFGGITIIEASALLRFAVMAEPAIDLAGDALASLVGHIFAYHHRGRLRDIGTKEGLEAARREFGEGNDASSGQRSQGLQRLGFGSDAATGGP